jgi:LmbE family N-acetylglucosaminyl deacetylase
VNQFIDQAIILSPHVDDAAFSIGGAMLDGRFGHTVVVNVFTISASAYVDGDVENITAIRKMEDKKFLANLTPTVDAIYLDRLDAPLRLGISDEEVCNVVVYGEDDIDHILAALGGISCSDSMLIAPLGLGNHVDHITVHLAGCKAENLGWRVAFYEDLPYGADLPEEQVSRRAAQASTQIGRNLVPCFLPFQRAGLNKERLLSAYASQLTSITIQRIRRHALRHGEPCERLWL